MSRSDKINPSAGAILWQAALAQSPGDGQGLPTLRLSRPEGKQVHVWAASLDIPISARVAFQKALSSIELERAGRFRFEEHRGRYIVAHGWLRHLLASYVGLPSAQLEFYHSPKGKPALSGAAKASELQFNLAHSEGLALVAIARGIPVGIDLERVRPIKDAGDLVARFFSQRESALFSALPEEEKATAFFNLWTRKEAWLKATGEGITNLLDRVEVSFMPGEPARLLTLPDGFAELSNWSLCDLKLAPGFAAACVLAADGAQTECYSCDDKLFGFIL